MTDNRKEEKDRSSSGNPEEAFRKMASKTHIDPDPEPRKPRVFKKACRVCGGDIIENIVVRFNAMHGSMILGPGSRNQFHESTEGYYCQSCGLKYRFVPEKKKKPKKSK